MRIFTFLFGIFLLLQVNAKSQSILEEGKLWCNTSKGTEGSTYESYFIKFEGDTLLNDVQYKIIQRSDDSEHQSWYDNGFIREDSSQKVYLYDSNNDEDELLYDFGLNIGDSILHPNGNYHFVDTVYYDTFSEKADSLKHIQFSFGATWIEGIGGSGGVLNGLSSFFLVGEDFDLVCYYENNELIYFNSNFSNCFPEYALSINEIENRNPIIISYHKNYVTLSLNKLNTNNARIQLYSLSGKKIMQRNLNGANNFQFINNQIQPGVYIFRFINNEYRLSDKLIIK